MIEIVKAFIVGLMLGLVVLLCAVPFWIAGDDE